ncbi:MAG: bifunctional oligoribonuclease/PAP phosphatase NrnA [Roseburia sp.]|nr:bifunctional oligoribonuclease/PAP phosphatase NrnA [Roseburia sp.]
MSFLLEEIEKAGTIAIGGHVRPDGDCIGSCMGLYCYIMDNYAGKEVTVFVEDIPASFEYLKKDEALEKKSETYELFISLDCGSPDRLGDAEKIFEKSGRTVNIDHHISNTEFAEKNHVEAEASSTSEVLCALLDMEKISFFAAQAFYTGIVHDTGVFKHSNTGMRTMETAGKLMQKGIPFGQIIDESFYQKTYRQLQIMGRCLLESVRVMDGKCLFSVVSKRVMEFYGAKPSDLDGVIDQLRTTEGVEVAILLTEKETVEYKVSMRSNQIVDVSRIASFFGGGGHIRAAGCTVKGSAFDVINNITEHIERQLKESTDVE